MLLIASLGSILRTGKLPLAFNGNHSLKQLSLLQKTKLKQKYVLNQNDKLSNLNNIINGKRPNSFWISFFLMSSEYPRIQTAECCLGIKEDEPS